MTSLILPDKWINGRQVNYVERPQNLMPYVMYDTDNTAMLLQQSTGHPLVYTQVNSTLPPPKPVVQQPATATVVAKSTTKSPFHTLYLVVVLVIFAVIGAFLGAVYDKKQSGSQSSVSNNQYEGEQQNRNDLYDD